MQVTEVNSGWGRLLSLTQGAAGTGCHCPQSPSFSLSPSHIDEVPVRRLIFSAWHLRPCTPGLLSQPLGSPALQQAAFPWGCRLPELPHTCTVSLTMAKATPQTESQLSLLQQPPLRSCHSQRVASQPVLQESRPAALPPARSLPLSGDLSTLGRPGSAQLWELPSALLLWGAAPRPPGVRDWVARLLYSGVVSKPSWLSREFLSPECAFNNKNDAVFASTCLSLCLISQFYKEHLWE